MAHAAERLRHAFHQALPDVYEQIQEGRPLRDEDRQQIGELAQTLIGQMYDAEPADGHEGGD